MEVDVGSKASGMKFEYNNLPFLQSKTRSMPEAIRFSDTMRLAFAPDVRNCWENLQSALHNHGLSATLDYAERKVTIYARTVDPNLIALARDCVILLCRVGAFPHMVIDVLKGKLQYEYVKIAYHDNGICSATGITEAEFKIRLRKFLVHHRALKDLLGCILCTTNEYVAAFGSSDAGPKQLRMYLDRCFVKNEDPAEVFRGSDENMALVKKFEDTSLLDRKPLNLNLGLELEKESCVVDVNPLTNDVKISCAIIPSRLSVFRKPGKVLVPALEKLGFGFCCTSDHTSRKITVIATSRTDDQDLIDRVEEFLTLLCKTAIPLEKAISVLNGEVHCEYIEIGNQESGLRAVHGISEKQFRTRLQQLQLHCKDIGDALGYSIYVNEGTVVGIGELVAAGKLVHMVVNRCIEGGVNPRKVSVLFKRESAKAMSKFLGKM